MKVDNCVALVTGANRGIGQEFVRVLLSRGARKVYAASRGGLAGDLARDKRVVALALDVTDAKAVAGAAARAADVALLVNNAGVNSQRAFIAAPSLDDARREMETNYFGTLDMCRAFAPVLKKNGGGAIVNMASILGEVTLPMMGSLCASKAALLRLTQGVRAELAGQGTRVLAVLPGAVDTDMSRDFPPPKMPPADVVAAVLDALDGGADDVYPGAMASGLRQGLLADPKAIERDFAKYLPQ